MSNDETKNVLAFVANPKDKEKAVEITGKMIGLLEGYNVGFKAYVLQMLILSFEETYDIDIRHSIAVSHSKE